MDDKVTDMKHVITAFSLTADAPVHEMFGMIVKKRAACLDPILNDFKQSDSSCKCIHRTQWVTGIGTGRIVTQDHDPFMKCAEKKPMNSSTYRVRKKHDFILRTTHG